LKRFDEIFAYDCNFIEYKEILFDEDDEDCDE